MGQDIGLDYKSKLKSINSKLIISFTLIMIATILSIKLFVNTIFKDSFEKYVDDSNKVEVNHLIEFDLKNLYTNESWNTEFIENLGIEAIRKGIAIEIYDKNDNKVWSVFEDEKVLSDKTLNDISKNMKSIEKQWDNYFEELKVDINDDERNILVGYAYIGHYASTYYMENDDLINSINKLSNELNDQENLRKQLTGDIAHELRTPLTSIKGHLDAIIVGIWEPTNERLNSINEEVKRITNLVDELRKLAKFDSGKDNLNKEIVNLKNYIKSIAYNYEGKALEKNIVIKYQLENIEALIDKEKFAQVIINILSNAIKYNNGNNAIYIKVFKKNNSINISIKDSGIGIPKSEYKNIFERFYRLDKSRGANEKGAGVGLTIAKSIVNAHGGEIEVYSEINKGSEFIISLPS